MPAGSDKLGCDTYDKCASSRNVSLGCRFPRFLTPHSDEMVPIQSVTPMVGTCNLLLIRNHSFTPKFGWYWFILRCHVATTTSRSLADMQTVPLPDALVDLQFLLAFATKHGRYRDLYNVGANSGSKEGLGSE